MGYSLIDQVTMCSKIKREVLRLKKRSNFTCCNLYSFVVYLYVTVVDQLPRLRKRELICLLLFTCNYVVCVWRGFLFLWVLGMGYVILLWHSLSLPYKYSTDLYYV